MKGNDFEKIVFEDTLECIMKIVEATKECCETICIDYTSRNNPVLKIADLELHVGDTFSYKNISDKHVCLVKCPKCNGSGMVGIAPGVRGIKECPYCNGKKIIELS